MFAIALLIVAIAAGTIGLVQYHAEEKKERLTNNTYKLQNDPASSYTKPAA